MLAVGTIFTACNKDEINALNSEINTLESNVTDLTGIIAERDASISSLESIINSNEAEIDSLGVALAAAASSLEDANFRIEGLEGDNAEQAAQIAALQAELSELEDIQASTKEALALAQAHLAAINSSLGDSSLDQAGRIEAIEDLEAEIEDLEDDLAECNAALAHLRANPIIQHVGGGSRTIVAPVNWSPAFVAQTANFDQTASVDGGIATRTVSVTSAPADSITLSNEADENIDVNSDGDMFDSIGSTDVVYTASFGLGSHTAPGVWVLLQNNEAPVIAPTASISGPDSITVGVDLSITVSTNQASGVVIIAPGTNLDPNTLRNDGDVITFQLQPGLASYGSVLTINAKLSAAAVENLASHSFNVIVPSTGGSNGQSTVGEGNTGLGNGGSTTLGGGSSVTDAWSESNGVYSNPAYPGVSFTVAPAQFPLTGFLATITGSSVANQGGETEAEAIANAQAAIAAGS